MQLGTLRRVPPREPVPQLLLPGHLRRRVAVLLAACVVVPCGLALYLAGRPKPAWPDSALDPRITSALSRFPTLLNLLPDLGTLVPVTLMTLALVCAFLAARRWTGAALAALAPPVAIGLTEYLLKPTVGDALGQGFPSGHATSSFALAALCALLLVGPPGRVPRPVRLALVLAALLLAAAVSAAMVANGAHYVTDIVAGAAVGTAVVLAGAFSLDLVVSRVVAGPVVAGPVVAGPVVASPVVAHRVRPAPEARSQPGE
jgi:membrane-associated phospholipid phosphatase